MLVEKAVEEALEAITAEVLVIFKRDYVMKYVYESHMPNVKYHNNTRKPTYEFLEAWDWTALRKKVNSISKELWFDSSKLSHDEPSYLHGSKYSTPEDVRDKLMDILNKAGRSSSLWLSSTAIRPVAYWDKFLDDFIDGGEMDRIITKHFASKGFVKV